MRIALQTLDPLPSYKSWFIFEENDTSTVSDLRKALNRTLQLAKKSSHIKLMSGGFEYLPQFKLKNYIRDNEVIIVESAKQNSAQTTVETRVVMETPIEKKNKKKDVDDDKKKKRAKEAKKREKEKEEKKTQVEEKKQIQQKQKDKELKKKRKREEEEDDKSNVELKEDEPVKKMTKTQKRNLRRKLVLKRRKEQQKEQPLERSTVEKEDQLSDDEPPTQLSSRREATATPPPPAEDNDTIKKASTRLLKQNKNKKANFLKHMGKKQQSHVRFEPSTSDNDVEEEEGEQEETVQDTQEDEQQQHQKLNGYGSAIVTWSEADDRYDGPTKGNVDYPIHNVGNYFRADAPVVPEKENESTNETSHNKNRTNKQASTPKVVEKPDYDKLPSLSFAGPFPEANDLLAIKLLEMSSSYTPEISDWKQVKVLEFDQEQGILNVEFQPGFLLKEQTGKFTIQENNGYYNQYDDEEEEEEEEEEEVYLEDQTKQLTQMDVVDMRRL